ncbi:hypothetical protein Tco_0138273 [Tanacetum coccineum]
MNEDYCEQNSCYDPNSFGFDQYQPPQFPVNYPPQETSREILQAQEDLIQAFLKEYDHIPPNEKCMALLLAEERLLKIKQAMEEEQNQPEVLQELLLKLINDLQILKGIQQEKKRPTAQSSIPYWNSSMIDDEEARDNFLKDVCTFLKKFSRIPFGVTPKRRPKAITLDLPIEEPDNSLNMGDEHLDTIPATESDEVIKSSVENLVLIPSEFEGISDDTSDVPTCDNNCVNVESDLVESLINRNTLIVYSSKIDPILEEFAVELAHIAPISPEIVEADFDPNDDTSSDDDSFENIEYVDASPSYIKFDNFKEVNDVEQEEKEFYLKDILQVQDVILREKLLNIHRLISKIESLKVNPTPDRVLKSPSPFPIPVVESDSFFEESDTSLSHLDNSLPEFETFSDHTEETRSGSTTTHANYSLPEIEPTNSEASRVRNGYMKNHMKTVKNGQARTRERKSEQKPEAKARKSQIFSQLQVYYVKSRALIDHLSIKATWKKGKHKGMLDFTLEALT